MILYRKAPQLRVRRMPSPEPPFWCASAIAPYSPRRGEPVAIDWTSLRATSADRLEVAVCSDVEGELDRLRAVRGPALIDAAGRAETVFRRGAEALAWCERAEVDALLLVSPEGTLPESAAAERSIVAIAAWPAQMSSLEAAFAAAAGRRLDWGVIVPVVYPVTTQPPLLEEIADAAAKAGARFLAAASIELEPTARQAIARSGNLDAQDDRYAMLFHGRVEPLALATERHLAALAAERGMLDFVPPAGSPRRTNWNGAALLMRIAARMLAMELDVDLAGTIARTARAVAALATPLERIAGAASLSIVEPVDDTSAEILTEWLESGSASFEDFVSAQWRLRRY